MWGVKSILVVDNGEVLLPAISVIFQICQQDRGAEDLAVLRAWVGEARKHCRRIQDSPDKPPPGGAIGFPDPDGRGKQVARRNRFAGAVLVEDLFYNTPAVEVSKILR